MAITMCLVTQPKRFLTALLLTSMWVVSTGFAYADALIGKGELVSIEALIVKDNCIRGCESDEWSIQPVALPVGYAPASGSAEQLYLATAGSSFCGSRGCISAYVLQIGTHFVKIKEGWNLGHAEKIQAHEVLAVKQKIRPISSTSTSNTIFSPEPNFIVNKGQTINQFTLKSFGEAFFSGQSIFSRGSYDNPEGGSYLAVYKSPDENHALVQLWDADKGGLRLALVDRVSSKILNNQIIPDGNVLGLVKADQVRWVNNGVAWSPDGRFAAVPYYFAEAEADLAVIDIVSGEFVIYPVRTSKTASFAFPDVKTIHWHEDDTLTVSFETFRCVDLNCDDFASDPDKQMLSLSLSGLINKADGGAMILPKEYDSFGSLLSKSLDIYELYKKAETISEMFKYARNLNTLDELEVSLSRFKLLGSGLSKKDISVIRDNLEANLLAEAGSIFAHFLMNKQYDYWESQGVVALVPRKIAESSMDTIINVASANLPGQLKDQTIAITEAYLDVRAQKTDYINSAIAYASTYVNALSGRERNYRSLIESMIVTNKSYLEDVAKKSIWISDFDSEAKINIINGLIKVRAFQVSSLTFGEDLASIKMLAETYDKFNWGSGNKYQKFADEVARSLNVSQSITSSSVSSAPRIGNIIDTRVIGSGNGCSCTFELTNSDVSAGPNQSIFFGADYRMTDGKAWMNINGRDVELLPMGSLINLSPMI